VTHRRILVVDDTVSATDALALILRHWGHTVLVCHDGRAGLDAAGEFRPDVVLLDIGLPGLDGYAVARLLRDRPEHRNAVLIAITGYGRDEDRQRSDGAGLDHHFVKPINLSALEALLADPALAPKTAAAGEPAEGLNGSSTVVPGHGFVETGRR
jgi:DNA-binding response OmpR family regulator